MATTESPREQLDKSRGLDPVDIASAASTHGTLRHVSGLTLIKLTTEYRALRASVLRLLAVLGHDLRSALAAMSFAGDVLVQQQPGAQERNGHDRHGE